MPSNKGCVIKHTPHPGQRAQCAKQHNSTYSHLPNTKNADRESPLRLIETCQVRPEMNCRVLMRCAQHLTGLHFPEDGLHSAQPILRQKEKVPCCRRQTNHYPYIRWASTAPEYTMQHERLNARFWCIQLRQSAMRAGSCAPSCFVCYASAGFAACRPGTATSACASSDSAPAQCACPS